jgi:hypothetical protein
VILPVLQGKGLVRQKSLADDKRFWIVIRCCLFYKMLMIAPQFWRVKGKSPPRRLNGLALTNHTTIAQLHSGT